MPVTASLIVAAIGTGVGAANVGMGIHDRKQGKKMLRNMKDPYYDIPQSYEDALANAQVIASSYDLPGQVNIEQKADQILSNNVRSINNAGTSSTEMLQALNKAYGNRMNTQNDIGAAAARSFMDRQGDVRRMQGVIGQQQEKQFDINTIQPFQRKYASATGLINNGNQLINAGSTQIANSVAGFAGGKGNIAGLQKKKTNNNSSYTSAGSSDIMLGDPTDEWLNENVYDYQLPKKYQG